MRVFTLLAAIGAALSLAGTAAAADCDAGKDGAKLSRLGSGDFAKDLLLGMMLPAPMKDGGVTLKQAAKLPKACDRGDFLAGKSRYRAYGQAPGRKGEPVRYALPENGKGPIAYLAPMEQGDKDGPWIVAVTDGDEMTAFVSIDAAPSDTDLRVLFAAALDGKLPRTLGLNLKTGGTTQYVDADSLKDKADAVPPKSSPGMPRPAPGSGPGGEAQELTAPDGVAFKAGPGGAMVHAATGFSCPEALNGYERGKVIIFDAAEDGRDVACQLVGKQSWMTVYLTKIPDSYSAVEVFSTYSEQARAAAPPKADIDPPWMLPETRSPSYADFWVGPEDERQGLWVMAIGNWYVKLRVTYRQGEEGELVELAQAVAKQVMAQVKPPEI
ncbi:MAG: hypothetical protein JWR84_334 [Caulobacter sp.]|nr:hypothetical protein [Caulobacter sp.]